MNKPDQAKKRSGCRSCLLFGCLPLLLLVLIPGCLMWLQARESLRERTKALRAEIADFEEAMSQPRPVLFGDPQPGNAADEYWLINYVTTPSVSWDIKIPVDLAPTRYSYKFAQTSGIETSLSSIKLINRVKAGDKSALPKDAARYLKAFGPLADHIRAGLRKERCDWNPPLEKGAAVDVVNLVEARSLANLMAYQAFMAEGEEGIKKALEVIAFGRDLARHPTLIHAMIGVAVQFIGFDALAPMLGRDLEPAAYRQVIAALGGLEPIDIERALLADRLCLSVHLAALSGEDIAEVEGSQSDLLFAFGDDGTKVFGKLLNNRLVLEREWDAYQRWHERALALAREPFTRRLRAAAEFNKELEEAWVSLARVAMPNVHEACKHAEDAEARGQALRMLAAAQLHRLETGSFPPSAAALKAYLGGALPRDPFQDRKKPLTYLLNEGTATVNWAQGSLWTEAPGAVSPKGGARPAGGGG